MAESSFYNDFFADSDEKPEVGENSCVSLPIESRVSGEILRIVFSNSDNSFSVVKMRGSDPLLADITLVGMLAGVRPSVSCGDFQSNSAGQ